MRITGSNCWLHTEPLSKADHMAESAVWVLAAGPASCTPLWGSTFVPCAVTCHVPVTNHVPITFYVPIACHIPRPDALPSPLGSNEEREEAEGSGVGRETAFR